jgi:hypothetical protein
MYCLLALKNNPEIEKNMTKLDPNPSKKGTTNHQNGHMHYCGLVDTDFDL